MPKTLSLGRFLTLLLSLLLARSYKLSYLRLTHLIVLMSQDHRYHMSSSFSESAATYTNYFVFPLSLFLYDILIYFTVCFQNRLRLMTPGSCRRTRCHSACTECTIRSRYDSAAATAGVALTALSATGVTAIYERMSRVVLWVAPLLFFHLKVLLCRSLSTHTQQQSI